MSRFRQNSLSAGMSTFNDGFMLPEEHKKPNIIRGSGTKLPKAQHSTSEPDNKPLEEFPKTESSIEEADENNIVFTSTELSSTDALIATFSENIQSFDENQLQSSLMSPEDMQAFEQQMINEPKESTEDQIVQAAISTPEGNFIVYMKGNEIISAHAVETADQPGAVEEENTPTVTETASSEIEIMQVPKEEPLEESVMVSQTDLDESSYMLYQLPSGETVLVPCGLEGISSDQFVISDNQQIMQFSPALEAQLDTPTPAPVKENHPRKRVSTEPPKKTYSKKPKKTYSTSTVMNTGNFSSTFVPQQKQQMSSLSTSTISSSVNNNDESRAFEQPMHVVELKPKPFRFDISEAEADGIEEGDNFLSLVIENFQTHLETHGGDEDKKPELSILPTSTNSGVNIKIEKAPIEPKCPKCSFKGADYRSLSQHVSRFHNEEIFFACNQCNKTFPYAFQLSSHKNIHHGISQDQALSCDACEKICKDEQALKFHIRTCSVKRSNYSEIDLSEEILPDIDSSSSEVVVEAVISKPSNRRKQTVYSRDKEYPCEDDACYKWFNDKFGLLRHQINVHLTQAPFRCTMCEKSYDSKEGLLSHMASHEDGIERPFECSVCQKCFKMESHLQGHMRAHIQKSSVVNAKSREQELLKHPEKLMQLAKISYRNKTRALDGIVSEVFCTDCDDVFPNQLSLELHRETLCPGIAAENDDNINREAEESADLVFDSITDWRKHTETGVPTFYKVSPVSSGRPNRNVADVQNDFKSLSTKIIFKANDENTPNEGCDQAVSKDGSEEVDENDEQQTCTDSLEETTTITVNFKTSNDKIKSPALSETVTTGTAEQTLSNDSITSIVNHMSSRMVTRAGIKTLKTEVRTKNIPVKKRNQLITIEHLVEEEAADNNVPDTSPTSRDLRSRNSKAANVPVKKSDTKIQNRKPVASSQAMTKSCKIDGNVDTSKVGKSFVSIFQKVKKEQENQSEKNATSGSPTNRK